MSVCDSVGNYILFQTGSLNPTRNWSRAETSGNDVCAPRAHEKLKYVVLKNPPSTVQVKTSALTAAYTVSVGKATYAIDPAIYAALNAYLLVHPAYSYTDIQARIKDVRAASGILPTLAVQLESIPITQYRTRRTYATGEIVPLPPIPKKFGFPYTIGGELDASSLVENVGSYFTTYANSVRYDKAHFLYVTKNVSCVKETKIQNLYPSKESDIFGAQLLSPANLRNFNAGSPIQFVPMLAYFSATNDRASGGLYRPRLGILFGVDLTLHTTIPIYMIPLFQANSELAFIPIETDLEYTQNDDFAVGASVNFQFTDGAGALSAAEVQTRIKKLGLNVLQNLKSVA